MTTLVVGASGATGRLLVEQLLERGQKVKIVVRDPNTMPASILEHENLSVITKSLLDFSDAELVGHVKGCEAVASCLGHNMSLKGIYGKPRRLVTDAVRRLCDAIKESKPSAPVKFVLMNTTGNRNGDLSEPISFGQHCVLSLLRLMLPPHVDNEQAANYLRTHIGQKNETIAWAVVRPDGLTDEKNVSAYEIHRSPARSAIFDAGQTSRINVGHFIADLVTDADVWKKWVGQMPVIYNEETQ